MAGKTEEQTSVNEKAQTSPQGNTNELVAIKLFYDGEKYKDDVFVAVNGRRFLIKRGETVMVPEYVKEVLDNSQKQDASARCYMEEESEKARERFKEFDM